MEKEKEKMNYNGDFLSFLMRTPLSNTFANARNTFQF